MTDAPAFRRILLITAALAALPTLVAVALDAAASASSHVSLDRPSYAPGDTVVVMVNDATLSTVQSCTAEWTDLAVKVPHGAWFSLATGDPQPDVYTITPAKCPYDRDTPAKTPLSLVPAPSLWQAFLNGVRTYVAYIDQSAGKFGLNTAVEDNPTNLTIEFFFDIVDSYPADEQRVRVASTSDAEGDWTAIAEVVSMTNHSPSPTSGVFIGKVRLASDEAALAPGDGVVMARPGDTLTAQYLGEDGEVIASASSAVVQPSPTPTPVPSASAAAMLGLAAAFGVLVIWRARLDRSAG